MEEATLILLRVAPIATDFLQVLHCKRVLELAQTVERMASRLARLRQARCDALYALVPGKPSPERRALLGIKRAVHNNRLPEIDLEVPELQDVLARSSALAADLRDWASDVETLHQSLTLGPAVMQADWVAVRHGLALAWECELLRRGVFHAKPQLFFELEKLFTRAGKRSDAPPTQTDLAFLAYVYRAVTKTSPFSTLTVTGVGRMAEDADHFHPLELDDISSVLVLAPDIISRLGQRWVNRTDMHVFAPVRTPDLLEVDGSRIVFLGESDRELTGNRGAEVIRILSDAPFAVLALRLIRASPTGHYTIASLRSDIAMQLGASEQVIEAMLAQLRACGLIRIELDYDSCRPTALDAVIEATTSSSPELEADLKQAQDVSRQLRTLASRPVREQATALPKTLADLQRLLGDTAPPDRHVAVFDRCSAASLFALPARAVQEIMPTLQDVLTVLPLFNVDLGAERFVQDFLRLQCANGKAVPILTAFAELRAFLDAHYRGSEWAALSAAADQHPSLRAATFHREALIADIRGRMGTTNQANSPTITLLDDFFRRWSEEAAAFAPRRTRLSASFLGQFIDTGDPAQPRFALNAVVAGYGTLAAAWACADPAHPAGSYLHRTLRENLSSLDVKGYVVEVAAALNFGGHVREAITPYFLPYPGEPSSADPDRRLDWRDLVLVHDQALDRVVLLRRVDGKRILPVNLGTLSSHHFPPFYRFLMCLGAAFTPTFSLVHFFEQELPPSDRLSPRYYPRIVAGTIVLSRMTCCMPAASLPSLGGGPLSFDDFLKIRSWARAFDLPRLAFVTGAQTSEVMEEVGNLRAFKRARKPFFVNFDDYLSCVLFHRFSRRVGSSVCVTEMLPTPEQNSFRTGDAGGRVVECVIEVQGGPVQ
jgi:hypothetical protein